MRFNDNIWVEDLFEMGLFPYKNKSFKYLLCVIDVFTKYPCIKPLKDKKKVKWLLILLSK